MTIGERKVSAQRMNRQVVGGLTTNGHIDTKRRRIFPRITRLRARLPRGSPNRREQKREAELPSECNSRNQRHSVESICVHSRHSWADQFFGCATVSFSNFPGLRCSNVEFYIDPNPLTIQ